MSDKDSRFAPRTDWARHPRDRKTTQTWTLPPGTARVQIISYGGGGSGGGASPNSPGSEGDTETARRKIYF